MTLDLEAQYNNRARVPENPEIMAGWARDAAAYREQRPPLTLAYGQREREQLDLFEVAPDAPLVVYIHGGYWQALDKSWHSHLAVGLNARGISVAVPSYDLCPDVRVGDILNQMRAATALLRDRHGEDLVVAGHSAGGQLAACLLSDRKGVKAAYAISGVFDLEPLIPTSLNGKLRLDAGEARSLSPIHWPAPAGLDLDCVVGADESDEFLRQSRDMADAWSKAGTHTRYEAIEAANHFTVIAGLADPLSPMTARVAQLTTF